jgi:hypothetical protein
MVALGEGEGVPDQFAFWELAWVRVCHGPTRWGGQLPADGSMVNW